MYLSFRIILCGFVSLLLVYFFSIQYSNAQGNTSVIAIVNGREIFYQDIKINSKIIQENSSDVLDPLQLKAAIYEAEKDILSSKIWKIIKTKKIIELGLTVSEGEIDTEVERKFKIGGIDEKKCAEMSKKYQVLADALESWQKEPLKSDEIYKVKLVTYMNKAQWNAFQVSYDTAEKLDKMRYLIPSSLEDMKKMSRDSSKKDVLSQKMQDIITSKVSVNNNEIEKYYQQKYKYLDKKPNLVEMKDALRQELLLKKKRDVENIWWEEQYNKAKIEIKDEKFKSVLEKYKDGKRGRTSKP